MSNCLLHSRPVTVRSGKENPVQTSTWDTKDIAEVSAYAFIGLSKREENQTVALWPHHFEALDQTDCCTEFTTDIAQILLADFAKFFAKSRGKPILREEIL